MLRRGWRGVAVAAVVAIAGSIASAQDGGRGGFGGGGGGMLPAINSRDLDRYQDMLNLTRDQRDTVKALFEGYQEQSRTIGQEMRDKMAEMRDQMRDGDAASRRGMGDMMITFRNQRQKADDGFFNDVQAVLTPEQKVVWPKVERTRRREQSINRGLMSGERADVIKLVEQENYPADIKAKLTPVLDQYEIDLDRELTARTKLFDENMTKVMDAMGAGGDPAQMGEKLQGTLQQTREASVRVRDTNRKAARQVEELLPDDKKAAFHDAFKQASFPNVYRPTQASRQIASAMGFADLTDDQKTAIAALKESHARDAAAMEEQLAQATEQQEMTITADQLMRRFGGGMMGGGRGGQGGPNGGAQQPGQGGNRGQGGNQDQGNRNGRGGQGGGGQGGGQRGGGGPGGGRDEGPAGELRQKVRDLDRNAQESLKKILRPEQVDRLPQPEGRGGGGDGGDARQRRRDAINRT